MNKIGLVLFSVLFLAGSITALNSLEKTKINPLEKTNQAETTEDAKGMGYPVCSGEMLIGHDDDGNWFYYYGGGPLNEQEGTCNVRVNHYIYSVDPDTNITMSVWSEGDVNQFEGLTYPNGLVGIDPGILWRIGKYIDADFNWNKPEDHCFVETYTTRHLAGQDFPLLYSSYNRDKARISVTLFEYLGNNNWDFLDVDNLGLQVENLNRPLTAIGTDKENYIIPEGEDMLQIKLTVTDGDLSCGKPDWYLIVDEEYQSSETFEIRIDGIPLDSVDQNSGAFGVYIIDTNTGELIIDWNSSDYLPGEYDVNITVFDTDGYHQNFGTHSNGIVGPFIVEEYGSQIEKIIHITKEGSICGDTDASGSVNVVDLTYLVDYLFFAGSAPNPLWTANVDGNGGVNVVDLIYLVDYIFFGGTPLQCTPIE